MYLLITKIVFAAVIFLLTLVTGFLPFRIIKHNTGFLTLCDVFASGIFLSASLLHLLPDAVIKFGMFYNGFYPLPYFICTITCAIFLVVDRLVAVYSENHLSNKTTLMSFFLLFLLTFHSLVEGAAVGINTNVLETAAIFFAIIAHKGSESFALTVNLHRFSFSAKTIKKIILIFSLMTPFGIFIASFIVRASITDSGGMLTAIFDAITAGTFLYLSIEQLVDGKRTFRNISDPIALALGVAVMAIVAIWI
ncbi:MAG: ZIP family metal transporter [Coxiellaceae bacterium]|jgi:zinc transporter 1/2/3|nr:ZIP family metal transporter [Coxiellaceae bacterium]